MSSDIVPSLAVLMVDYDEKAKDYLQNFVPMIAECIRLSPENLISLIDLGRTFEEKFGFRLPQSVIEKILRRAEHHKYVQYNETAKAYRPNRRRLAKLNFAETQKKVLKRYEHLIQALRDFCREKFGIEWTIEQAETALLAFLSENQLSLLNATTRGTLIPQTEYEEKSARYLVGAFIADIQKKASTDFEYLETVVKGNMLANAIFLPRTTTNIKMKWSTTFYFDTRFLIHALGYSGKTLQEPLCARMSATTLLQSLE